MKSHGAHMNHLAAVRQPLDRYFPTEVFATASREGGPLSQLRNCGNSTTKCNVR